MAKAYGAPIRTVLTKINFGAARPPPERKAIAPNAGRPAENRLVDVMVKYNGSACWYCRYRFPRTGVTRTGTTAARVGGKAVADSSHDHGGNRALE